MFVNTQRTIILSAILSRLLVWALGMLAYHTAGTYDTSAQLMIEVYEGKQGEECNSSLDTTVWNMFAMFSHWDGMPDHSHLAPNPCLLSFSCLFCIVLFFFLVSCSASRCPLFGHSRARI